jgi:hypothetical protein
MFVEDDNKFRPACYLPTEIGFYHTRPIGNGPRDLEKGLGNEISGFGLVVKRIES